MRGYPQHYIGPRFFGGGLGMLCFLLIIGLLVYLVVTTRRDRSAVATDQTPAAAAQPPVSPAAQTPADIVRMRYARGEIARDEFETMLKDLE